MSVTKQFNGLAGTTVTREYLIELQAKAKAENHKEVYERVSKFLANYPDDKKFEIEIDTPARETRGLSVPVVPKKKGEELHYMQDNVKVASINKHGVITWHKKGIPSKERYQIRKAARVVGLGCPNPEDFNGMLHGIDMETENHEQIYGLGKAVSPDAIYDMVTKRMLDLIEKANKGDYERAWNDEGYLIPYNFVSKKPYRGINSMMLTPLFGTLDNPYFLTFTQIKEKGGKLKKGSKGQEVVYFSRTEKEYSDAEIERINKAAGSETAKKGDKKEFFFLKYYNVFSASDIEGIDFDLDNFKLLGKVTNDVKAGNNQTIDIAEKIVTHYPKPNPKIEYKGNKAFFAPSKDLVSMPPIDKFKSSQDFYRTLFHELSHSTGHENRLKRDFSGAFGSPEYAFEELTAEFGAVFLSAQAGIMFYTNKNHAGYLKGWNEVLVPQLKKDNRFLMRASSAAQKAADFILQPDSDGIFKFLKKEAKKTDKKEIKKAVEKEENYPFFKEEIPYDVAYRAYTGISFTPEKRAVSEQNGYFDFLKSVYDENHKKAKASDKLEIFETNFLKFKEGYLKRSLDYLRSKHGIFSSMIAGSARFPVARMEKKNRIANDKLNELVEYGKIGQKRLLASITPEAEKPIKTGAKGTLEILQEKLKEAEKNHKKNLEGNKLLKKIRSNPKATTKDLVDGLIAIGFNEEVAKKEADYFMKYTYAGFHTANSNAKVKRIKDQIALEEKLNQRKSQTGNKEYSFKNGKVLDNYELNKIQVLFDNKPDEKTRSFLKKSGQAFKWSPNNGAWQRQLNTYYRLNREDLFKFLEVSANEAKDQEKTKNNTDKDKKNTKTAAKYPNGTVVNWDGVIYEVGNSVNMSTAASSMKYLLISGNTEIWTDEATIDSLKAKENQQKVDKNGQVALFGSLNAPDVTEIETIYQEVPAQVPAVQQTIVHVPMEEIEDPEEERVITPLNRNSLAYRKQNRSNTVHEYYTIENPDIATFLGKIEKKKKESVAITIAGGQGSGKTSFVFQLMNAFSKHYKVGHASIEEHPESALYEDKAERFWNENAKATIDSPEINSMQDIKDLILRNDVIVIDSFSKLLSMDNKISLDETFRKKYDGKLFVIIYQLTTDGKMRGGSSSQFDGDVILFVEKFPDFKDNYVYADKNRYQNRSLDELHYNIATAKLVQPEEEEEDLQFEEVERI
ncbi:zincin-like metallopeptidase domain-containing protein [Flavobacterium commune]|uniref:Antirestriction protein n=1 Tax=Flavobacterium commune TaxID=1306519 RepID=A0A1D9PBU3_9FLAO|nr:zincin-like metallopeptidase domain-containing protein [Flavobacterium commune]AOZ99585.1 hypothetical protein BIW12_09110 [Flavobacterium commune]